MKIAIRKEEGGIPGSGYHYMAHPIPMRDEFEANCFKLMGHIIIEVPDNKGEQLLMAAKAALAHQLEIAVFADAAESIEI